ncbi:hypothetical protein ACFOQM_04180 [Paenibacillus sp. GCM10012307]|uniref:DUF3945 domain-containing protein n=1 Tax=Paenibacillus roseus TaxID=2798579 RepID=A0A934IWC4_9BACL|nr:hypothetical protein [Paenibacillus roseus]MBJ6360511.1 hypothetical protein [Paenibacillus roseus]
MDEKEKVSELQEKLDAIPMGESRTFQFGDTSDAWHVTKNDQGFTARDHAEWGNVEGIYELNSAGSLQLANDLIQYGAGADVKLLEVSNQNEPVPQVGQVSELQGQLDAIPMGESRTFQFGDTSDAWHVTKNDQGFTARDQAEWGNVEGIYELNSAGSLQLANDLIQYGAGAEVKLLEVTNQNEPIAQSELAPDLRNNLQELLDSMEIGESRTFQFDNKGDAWNVQKSEQGFVVRDQFNPEIVQSTYELNGVGSSELADAMVKYGAGDVKVLEVSNQNDPVAQSELAQDYLQQRNNGKHEAATETWNLLSEDSKKQIQDWDLRNNLEEQLDSLAVGESRSFQFGNKGDTWNIERSEQGFVVRDQFDQVVQPINYSQGSSELASEIVKAGDVKALDSSKQNDQSIAEPELKPNGSGDSKEVIQPVQTLKSNLQEELNSMVVGENRSFQFPQGDIWNVERNPFSFIVRDRNVDGGIETLYDRNDAQTLAQDMIIQGSGEVKMEANRWKQGEGNLKDTLKTIDGVPTMVSQEQLNTPVERYRLGRDRFEFQLKGEDRVLHTPIEKHPHLSKELKDLAIEQAASGVSEAVLQNNLSLGR